jgi:hypothetical protein
MKRLLLLALLTTPVIAGQTVTHGTWDVYSGTSRVASETTEAACIERGKAMKLAKFGCRTITTVIVTADQVPEPPVVVPPVIVPEPPKPEPPKPEPPKPVDGKPTVDNTGPTSALRPLTGNQTISKAGTVLEGFELRGGQITVTAPGVRLRNFRISGEKKVGYGIVATDPKVKDLIIEDCDIFDVTSIGVYGHDFELRRCHIHQTGSDGVRPTGPALVERNFIEKLGYDKAHADAVQMLVGSHVTFRYNHIDIPFDDPTWMNSACFMIQRNKGPVDDILVERNWLRGGDYCIRFTSGVTNYRVRENIMLGKHEYGPWGSEVERLPAAAFCGNVDATGKLFAKNKACVQ